MRSSRVAQRKSNSRSNDMTGRVPAIIWSSMVKNVSRSIAFLWFVRDASAIWPTMKSLPPHNNHAHRSMCTAGTAAYFLAR